MGGGGGEYSTKLWHDSWCGGPPLKENFLELYGIAQDRYALVAYGILEWGETVLTVYTL